MNPNDEYVQVRRQAAMVRSYTSPAVLTLVLYFVLWIPGLIANLVYYNQAKSDMALTGHEPEGYGCLKTLLVVFIGIPVGGLVLLLVVGGLAGLGS